MFTTYNCQKNHHQIVFSAAGRSNGTVWIVTQYTHKQAHPTLNYKMFAHHSASFQLRRTEIIRHSSSLR